MKRIICVTPGSMAPPICAPTKIAVWIQATWLGYRRLQMRGTVTATEARHRTHNGALNGQ